MKIATVKQECSDGDKATITGEVKWIDVVKEHQGREGPFHTQSVLVVDGEETDDKRNSIFCRFYADKGDWGHLKGEILTIQGKVNIWKGNMGLQGCSVKPNTQQPDPPDAPQGPSQPAGPPKDDKEARIIRVDSLEAVLGATDVPLDMVGDYLIASEEWIKTGVWSLAQEPATPAEQGQSEVVGEDIPF